MSYDFVVFDYGRGRICLYQGTSETHLGGSPTGHALYLYYLGKNYINIPSPQDPTELAPGDYDAEETI